MPEQTASEFTADGYFKTGDVATESDDGYITIVGRSKDIVITGARARGSVVGDIPP